MEEEKEGDREREWGLEVGEREREGADWGSGGGMIGRYITCEDLIEEQNRERRGERRGNIDTE